MPSETKDCEVTRLLQPKPNPLPKTLNIKGIVYNVSKALNILQSMEGSLKAAIDFIEVVERYLLTYDDLVTKVSDTEGRS